MRASEETYHLRKRRGRMSTRSRVALAAASLLLLSVYVLPIWKISLDAPQYPEGLGLYIEVNTIRGASEGNLASINGLNHYIGMKEIHPGSIPELKIMPWLFGALIVLGLAAAAGGRKWMLYAWVGLFVVLAAIGLIDFYMWEYDYGHNLDQDRAIIKVPGMTYQPPLIGSKKMLNITATSLPALGGIAAFMSLAIGLVFTFVEMRAGRGSGGTRSTAAVALALVISACSTGPRPIDYGDDLCQMCKMVITDARYGAEIITNRGKVLTFDSIECLTDFVRREELVAESVWVTDMANPGTLIRAEGAYYLYSEGLRSPMGGALAAFSSENDRDHLREEKGGDAWTWGDVIESRAGRSGHAGNGLSTAVHVHRPDGKISAGRHQSEASK